MSNALEQKFADALDGLTKLGELEQELASKRIFMNTSDHPFVDLVASGHAGMIGAVSRNVLLVEHEGRYYETRQATDGLIIQLTGYNMDGQLSVEAVDLVQRVKRLIGEDAPVQVKISSLGPSGKDVDVKLYVKIDALGDKELREAYARFLTAPEITSIGYDAKDYTTKGPALTVYTEGQYDPRLISLLSNKSQKTSQSEIGSITFELPNPVQSVADFVALVKESADAMQTERYIIASLGVQAPLRDVEVLQKPPTFELKHEDGIKLRYEASRKDELRLQIPKTQLAKAVEFYDGLKVE